MVQLLLLMLLDQFGNLMELVDGIYTQDAWAMILESAKMELFGHSLVTILEMEVQWFSTLSIMEDK